MVEEKRGSRKGSRKGSGYRSSSQTLEAGAETWLDATDSKRSWGRVEAPAEVFECVWYCVTGCDLAIAVVCGKLVLARCSDEPQTEFRGSFRPLVFSTLPPFAFFFHTDDASFLNPAPSADLTSTRPPPNGPNIPRSDTRKKVAKPSPLGSPSDLSLSPPLP